VCHGSPSTVSLSLGRFRIRILSINIHVRPPSLPQALASSSSDAAVGSFSHSPPLYRDALTSVLACLTLRELAVALAVCKEWTAAIHAMRPSMLTAEFGYTMNGVLSAAASSCRLLCHVGHLIQLGEFDEFSPSDSVPSAQLSNLSRAMPQLLSMRVCLDGARAGALWTFPSQLQRLTVFLSNIPDGNRRGHEPALLESIGHLRQLHTLRLEMLREEVSLAPLQQLPLLRDLQLRVSFWNVAHFAAELRALPSLHRLYIDGRQADTTQALCAALLHALLREEPEGQLCALQRRHVNVTKLEWTDELRPLLLRLPSLECLEANLMRCRRFGFLAALPRLKHLDVELWWRMGAEDDSWTNWLSAFTSDSLVRLQSLRLHRGPYTGDDLG
jgi:hypothetical protein